LPADGVMCHSQVPDFGRVRVARDPGIGVVVAGYVRPAGESLRQG